MTSLRQHQEDRLCRLLDAWCDAQGFVPECALELWHQVTCPVQREWLDRFIAAWDMCGASRFGFYEWGAS